jgi:hypothetical protein
VQLKNSWQLIREIKMGKARKTLKDILDVGAEGTISVVGETVAGVVGQFLPGITNVYFSYRQKKFEKNMQRFKSEMQAKEAEFNQRLSEMEEAFFEEFKNRHLGIVTDYIVDEAQEDKIKFMVNGLVNLATHDYVKEDFILFYYDTLRELRLTDIGVLRFYFSLEMGYQELLDELGIDYDQYNSIREKLVRLRLLKTKRDDEIDNLYQNVIAVQTYLESAAKGKSAKLNRMKRLTKNDSYSISRFGRDFVHFFIE